jgi:hypothetical protein
MKVSTSAPDKAGGAGDSEASWHTQTTRRAAHSGRCLCDQGCAECHRAGGAVMKRPVKERVED